MLLVEGGGGEASPTAAQNAVAYEKLISTLLAKHGYERLSQLPRRK